MAYHCESCAIFDSSFDSMTTEYEGDEEIANPFVVFVLATAVVASAACTLLCI